MSKRFHLREISLEAIKETLHHRVPFSIINNKNEDIIVVEVSPLDNYSSNSIVFIHNSKYLSHLKDTLPKVIVTTEEVYKKISHKDVIFIITKNVKLFNALFLQTFFEEDFKNYTHNSFVHPTAIIHESVKFPDYYYIGPNVVINQNVRLDNYVYIGANVVIENDVEIGENTVIYPNVYIGWGTKIGKDCRIYPGTIIGSDGFGFAQDEYFQHYRIPQLGIVEIEDNVVIGANCSIDRASYQKTIIRKGVIIDNLVHIAHNCDIGENSVIVAQVGIAGSTKLGKRVICGGQVGISDHVSIADDTVLLARSAVLDDIPEKGVFFGYPAIPFEKYQKIQKYLLKLDKYVKKMEEIEDKLKQIFKITSYSPETESK